MNEDAVRAWRALLLALPSRRYPHVAAADALAARSDRGPYFDRGTDLITTGVLDAARAETAGALKQEFEGRVAGVSSHRNRTERDTSRIGQRP